MRRGLSAAVSGGEVHGHVRAVVAAIKPAIEKAKGEPGDPVDNAVRANVRETVKRLEAPARCWPTESRLENSRSSARATT